MAPEVIKGEKYSYNADIWSVGVTAIEMAEGKPPLSNIHPYRAMLSIPNRTPPTLTKKESWSNEFNDFIKQCLTKAVKDRPESKILLNHPFIRKGEKSSTINVLSDLLNQLQNKYSSFGGRQKYIEFMKKKEDEAKAKDEQETVSDEEDYKKKKRF